MNQYSIRKCFFLIGLALIGICSNNAISQEILLGADLSYLNEMKDCGALYYEDGIQKEVLDIFQDHQAKVVRLRLWHTPDWTNYSTFPDVKLAISNARSKDFKILLDFHYSDTWADPGKQIRPAAWNGITDNTVLADSVYQYTYYILDNLNNLGLMPEYVQIGNETNPNILLEEGQDLWPLNWNRNVPLFEAGIKAVHDINENNSLNTKTLIHIADPNNLDWWFTEAQQHSLTDFDIIGVSYYPGWHDANIQQVGSIISQIKQKFQKDVWIVETGYPWTLENNDNANNIMNADFILNGYPNPPTPAGQKQFMVDLTSAVISNGGMGVIYWEPAWVSTNCSTQWGQGSHYENATFFDFEGNLLSAIEFYQEDYSSISMPELQQFRFYPNPGKDFIEVQSSSLVTQIELYNMSGQLVKLCKNPSQGIQRVNINCLKAGTYLLKVNYKDSYENCTIIKG